MSKRRKHFISLSARTVSAAGLKSRRLRRPWTQVRYACMTVHVSNLASKVTFASEQAEAEDLIQEVEALSSDMQGTAGREAALLGQLRDKEQEVAKASTEYMRYSQVLCAAGAPGQACDDMRACVQPDHDHVQTAAGGSGQVARSQRRQTCRAQPGSGRPKLSDRCVGAESA